MTEHSARPSPLQLFSLQDRSGSQLPHGASLLLLICLLLTLAGPCFAQSERDDGIRVLRTRVGFDGLLRSHLFQPISVQLENLNDTPWQGTLRLDRMNAWKKPVDVTITLPVSLQERESKWVQLVPFAPGGDVQWKLRWGDGQSHSFIIEPSYGEGRAMAWISNDDSTSEVNRGTQFPAACFPESVAALDSLSIVILNEVPQFTELQAQALIDWLHLGGRIAILQNAAGEFPTFSGMLAPLQQNMNQFSLRRGQVVKFPVSDPDRLPVSLWSQFESIQNKSDRNALHRELRSEGFFNRSLLSAEIFSELLEMARFKRNWPLIWIAVVAYLIVLATYCYRVGHHQRKVGRFYLAFLGSVAGFSLIFWLLGQLGASARNQAAIAGIAHEISPGRFNVTQWSQFASVNPEVADFHFPGEAVWSSTETSVENAFNVIQGGPDASASFSFLPASTERLLQRSVILHRRLTPSIQSLNLSGNYLNSISVSIAGVFDSPPLIAKAFYEDYVVDLKPGTSPHTLVSVVSPERISSYLKMERNWRTFSSRFLVRSAKPLDQKPRDWDHLSRVLIGASFQFSDAIVPDHLLLDPNRVRLVILTSLPEAFHVKSDQNWEQKGYVLWVFDLPVSGSRTGP